MMKVRGATTTRLTFEEFERLPDQPGKRELLKGELIELPRAESKHSRIAHRVLKQLDGALAAAHHRDEADELGDVFHEMGYQLCDGSWAVPDVSVTFAGQPEEKYLSGSPAIAVEIVSPSNTAEALDVKTALYFQYGAREVWLVYPKTRHVVVYADGVPRIVRANETITTLLLPGLALSVAGILGE